MAKTLTHKEFLERFYEKNSHANDIEILGEYINKRTKIECRCKIDGHIWSPIANDLMHNNYGCPICSKNTRIIKQRKTHEEFMKDFYDKNPNANNIEILGEYINKRTKIKCKCKIDGHEWSVAPSNLLSHGHGCPICKTKKQRKTHEEFMKDFYDKNPNTNNIEILGEYITNKTPIKCRCKIDGHEWTPTPNSLLSHGYGCPKCYGNIKKTTEQFIKEMNEINPNIEILGEYVNSTTKIKCRCKIDGHEWSVAPSNLLSNGSGCPKCNSSKGELAISNYLQKNNIKFIPQHKFENCKYKYILSFDFYLPKLNIVIEYDGIQHFEVVEYFGGQENFEIAQKRDNIKTNYCKDNDIKLIRIPYWEFENIEEILNKELLEQRNKFIS